LLENDADIDLVKNKISKKAYKRFQNFLLQVENNRDNNPINSYNRNISRDYVNYYCNMDKKYVTDQFKFAIEEDDIQEINQLLKIRNSKGERIINVNCKEMGKPLLMNVIQMNIIEVLKSLLKCPELNVNEKFSLNYNALLLAISKRYVEIAKLLIGHHNIDINMRNVTGSIALMGAVECHQIEILKLLLNHPNIDVNIKNNFDYTALLYAVDLGFTDAVKLLIEKKIVGEKEW